MAARLTRAKKKIKSANIPYRVPIESEFPLRIDAVLSTLQLVFTTGHTAPTGSELVREDLIESSIQLTRMLNVLLPDHPDVQGLLALILLTNARQRTRVDVEGRLLLLSEQDRSLWNRESIVEGLGLVRLALRSKPVGRFVLMASIAAVHAESPTWEETDWNEIVGLYDVLLAQWPSPVVALNRAVSIGLSVGPQAGLDALDLLSGDPYLADYSYLASARADFLRRLNRFEEARDAYVGALALSENDVERNFLMGRLSSLDA
jgi:RNA polymerase sigma-70 factor (ECF subfamily)